MKPMSKTASVGIGAVGVCAIWVLDVLCCTPDSPYTWVFSSIWVSFFVAVFQELVPRRRDWLQVIPVFLIVMPTASWLSAASVWAIHGRGWDGFNVGTENGQHLFFSGGSIGLVLAFVASMLWLWHPRPILRRPYVCRGCGYDLRGSLHSSKCPECGRVLVVGEDIPDLKDRDQRVRALERLGESGDGEPGTR